MSKNVYERKQSTETRDLEGDYRYSLEYLLDLCGNNTSACVQINWCGDEADLQLTWQRAETDEEYATRIARHEAHEKARAARAEKRKLQEQQRAEREARDQEAQERALYLKLKQKFDPQDDSKWDYPS